MNHFEARVLRCNVYVHLRSTATSFVATPRRLGYTTYDKERDKILRNDIACGNMVARVQNHSMKRTKELCDRGKRKRDGIVNEQLLL